ncbi:spermidine synthase [Desulfocicer vacuolatum DSM 3385]|uniref:Polyamine aminopropyltransferase n=1 Tax=Desulfocicer vacuolatum DSM 3385 TaxID=1121400 RepID=A0A1W2B7L0_9BACT|nr:polyamine aminopropyltransferase [Desulfocicer vacuolatum]SMC68957.1 spermidine synthase [Desulfocicer vacuolatum DSM 3385]
MFQPSRSRTLQIALFATGCSGIVAEFVLSTLATYLMGNATFQWTMIMSIMLFAMGVGSAYSRHFKTRLLDTFVFVEFTLSSLCSVSAMLCFGLSPLLESRELVIYPLAFGIGFLIGLEIPIVTRLNSQYEALRTNISKVLEMDYFGSLIGGILFAFVFLPVLGFIYTPVLLGGINFLVASWLLWRFFDLTTYKKTLVGSFITVLLLMGTSLWFAGDIVAFSEQKKYKDTIIYAVQTKFQKIVITRWKKDYWLFINGQEQFSTFDEEKYHEPIVHPAMAMAPSRKKVLILGGGDGLAAREVLKYADVESLTLVDLDPVMTELATHHPILSKINNKAFSHEKTTIVNGDGALFLEKSPQLYNVIIIDLPDPDSMDLMHLYSHHFYHTVKAHLSRGGVMITQASSPFFARKAFLCINKTIQAAGFSTLPMHNAIPTLGQWGWILAVDKKLISAKALKEVASQLTFDNVETRFLSQGAMVSMIHFGKGVFDVTNEKIKINTSQFPVLYRYYHQGTWGVY